MVPWSRAAGEAQTATPLSPLAGPAPAHHTAPVPGQTSPSCSRLVWDAEPGPSLWALPHLLFLLRRLSLNPSPAARLQPTTINPAAIKHDLVFNNHTANHRDTKTALQFPSQGLQLVLISSCSDNFGWCHQVVAACISAPAPGAGCPLTPHRAEDGRCVGMWASRGGGDGSPALLHGVGMV